MFLLAKVFCGSSSPRNWEQSYSPVIEEPREVIQYSSSHNKIKLCNSNRACHIQSFSCSFRSPMQKYRLETRVEE